MADTKPVKAQKKQVKALKKKLAVEEKEIRQAKLTVKRVRKQAARKIAAEKKKKVRIKKVVKVVRKKGLGTYQYFMRQQLRDGKTFEQAARAWAKFKAYVERGKLPMRVRIVHDRPKVVTRTKVRTVVKPRIITRTKIKRVRVPSANEGMFRELLHELQNVKKKAAQNTVAAKAGAPAPEPLEISHLAEPAGISEEQQAFELVRLYIMEVAHHGLKRKLDLDQVINAYLYALGRVSRKDAEVPEIMQAVKRL